MGTFTSASANWLNLTVDYNLPTGTQVNVPFIEGTYVSSASPNTVHGPTTQLRLSP